MIPFRKTYDRNIHGPINGFPVLVVLIVLLNLAVLIGGTYIAYGDKNLDQGTIDRHYGSNYQIVDSRADMEPIQIVLLEGPDKSLYYVGFHRAELINRYRPITDKVIMVSADGTTRYQAGCFAGSVSFTISEDRSIMPGVSSETMNVVQRYLTFAVILLALEFTVYAIVAHLIKR